jgi:phosphate-selective porin OprO/OprP
LIGEYVISSQEIKSTATKIPTHMRLNNEAWQLEGSCFLTGDENSFRYTSKNGFNPTHALNLRGNGWGALELVARVGQLSLDKRAFPNYATSTSAQEATSWGIGLNWYLNRNVRLYLDYESTHFKGGNKAAGSLTANGEHVLLSQIQFEF